MTNGQGTDHKKTIDPKMRWKQFKNVICFILNDRVLAILLVTAVLTLTGFFLGWSLKKPHTTPADIDKKMEELASLQDIFVTGHYHESVVEIRDTCDTGTVKLLLVIPSRIRCFIDLKDLNYSLEDSVLNIDVPPPEFEEPVLYLDSISIYEVNGTGAEISRKTYSGMFNEFQNALELARHDAREKAEATGIIKETGDWGAYLFKCIFQSSDYRIEFDLPDTPDIQPSE